MEIRSLADIGFGTLPEAFSRAFTDYEVQLDRAQLRTMLLRGGSTLRCRSPRSTGSALRPLP